MRRPVDDHQFTFVDNVDALERFAQECLPQIDGRTLALDIEEDREKHYHPRVALVQITWDEHDVVLDPLALPWDHIAPVIEALCLTPSEVIMHGCRNDVTGLKRDFGVGPRVVRDTQTAARFGGLERFGLAPLLEEVFGIALDKEERRSDWTQRPLSEAQLAYARADTSHLRELWEHLYDIARDRGWEDALEEECQATADLPAERPTYDPFGWLRVKGARSLEGVERNRLAALWAWREDIGRQLDIHPSRVLPPWAMVMFAERGARAVDGDRRKRGVHPRALREGRDALLDALTDPPRAPMPARERSSRDRRTLRWGSITERTDRLRAWREQESEATGLEPGFLAPRGIIDAIARTDVERPEDFDEIEDIRQWRVRRYADIWLDVLRGDG